MFNSNYLAHLIEMQEMAFLKWVRSRYSDIEAHDEWLQYRQLIMKFKELSKQ